MADLADLAWAATATLAVVETLDGYEGAATVATYTVTYDGMAPVRTVAVCDLPDGRRSVAVAEDADLAAEAVAHELIGRSVQLAGGSLTLR